MTKKKIVIYIVAPVLLLMVIIFASMSSPMDSFSRFNGNKTKTTKSFNKQTLSIDDPTSLWVVINKKRPLQPANFTPNDLVVPNVPLRFGPDFEEMKLRKSAATSLEQMVAAAKKENVNLMLASGYRSYELQTSVYSNFVTSQGQATADTQSARPGYSEHQTGLAVDLGPTDRTCEIELCFANTAEGKWLQINAYKYGFIIRYQPNTQATVGYTYEPWHFRYVGTELAVELHKQNNPTLEDFFGLPPAANYN